MDWTLFKWCIPFLNIENVAKGAVEWKRCGQKNDHGFGRKKYGYSCGSLALQSPGGSSVAMFKNTPTHRWLPTSTTDPQHGLNICSNDAFPFCTSKILHRALSNDRDEINGRTQYGYRCGFLLLGFAIPWGSSVAMFKSSPIHRWLPNSTTDPQHGLNICSNDAFPFWTSKMLQKALSNERDVVRKNSSWFWPEKVWI